MPLTAPKQDKVANESSSDASPSENICGINRTAFNTLRSQLDYLDKFYKRVLSMEKEAAAEDFRKYYSTDRQEFFRQAPKKLNILKLNPSDVQWFTKTCEETSEILDDIIYYVDDNQFRNTAYSKLPIPIDNLRLTISSLQDLLRLCKE